MEEFPTKEEAARREQPLPKSVPATGSRDNDSAPHRDPLVEELLRRPPDVRASFKPAASNVIPFPHKKSKHPDWDFFCTTGADGKTLRFRVPKLGDYILKTTPTMQGGGELLVYHEGVYLPGEGYIRTLIAEILGSNWSAAWANSTVTWIWTQVPLVEDTPPDDMINVLNGMIAVGEQGDVEFSDRHDPKLGLTVQLPVRYDPKARCPEIEKYLARVLPDEVDRKAVLEIAGYMLVPDNSLQKAFMMLGEGGNGRSIFLGLLTHLLGKLNVSHKPLQKLDSDKFALAALYGKLANIVADISSEELRKTSVFKGITGGDRLDAEHKYGHSFSYTPFARLIFSCNEIPVSRDGSLAYEDRWFVMRWDRRVRGTAEQKRALLQDLVSDDRELSGFLNLALEGLARLRGEESGGEGEFSTSAASERAHLQFIAQSNTVAQFAAEWRPQPGSWREKSRVYREYVDWCGERELRTLSAVAFFRSYARHAAVTERKRRGDVGYKYE